mmetsp:Transcript_26020/g.77160  ORF Transcript_26020/g.77160 Transcript_26020/m.77160 type:complete len:165 (-) Transcript_26020:398-892(-)
MEPLKGRVAAAAAALQHGVAPRVVLSGAHPRRGGIRGVSEANAMERHARALAKAAGVPFEQDRWIKEEASTSTRENALCSLRIAQRHGWRRVAVATSPFHQRRSLWVFLRAARDLGLDVRVHVVTAPFVGHAGHPLRVFDAAVDAWDWVREVAAIAWYYYKGFL